MNEAQKEFLMNILEFLWVATCVVGLCVAGVGYFWGLVPTFITMLVTGVKHYRSLK